MNEVLLLSNHWNLHMSPGLTKALAEEMKMEPPRKATIAIKM